MICPHCRASLRQRERPNLTCSKCKRTFAFDPKSNGLNISDMMVLKASERLSDNGKLRYTARQLWYALSRKALRANARSSAIGCGWGVALLVLFISGSCLYTGIKERAWGFVATAAVVLLVCVSLSIVALANRRTRTLDMPMRYEAFTGTLLDRWRRVYGQPPLGFAAMADFPGRVVPDSPVLAVLCPDRSVLLCLQANDIPQRLHAALVSRIDQVPVRVPVLVLHDASPDGCRLAGEVRGALPGRRVMDAGLRPHQVMAAKGAVRLRTAPLDEHQVARLRDARLPAKELAWLAQGWWSPIGAVRPAVLVARVEEAARRAGSRASVDSAEKAAKELGFLTWPA
jgi:hypothetical protein